MERQMRDIFTWIRRSESVIAGRRIKSGRVLDVVYGGIGKKRERIKAASLTASKKPYF